MVRIAVALAFLAASAPAAAAADPTDITFYSRVSPTFRDGELSGCSAVFDVLHRDSEYHRGEYVHVSGSLSYTIVNSAPYFTLKLGVRPNPDTSNLFVRPAEAFLIQGSSTNKANFISPIDAEMASFRMFPFYGADPTSTMAMTFVGTGKLSFGYAMEPHGMLSVVQADLEVANIDVDRGGAIQAAPDGPGNWLQCIADVTKLAMAKTNKP